MFHVKLGEQDLAGLSNDVFHVKQADLSPGSFHVKRAIHVNSSFHVKRGDGNAGWHDQRLATGHFALRTRETGIPGFRYY